jgi:hypothetical protein
MLADRETALRADRRLSATKWLPGHLASWAGGAGAKGAKHKGGGSSLRASGAAPTGASGTAAPVPDAEADAEDDEFIFAWQTHTEGLRSTAAAHSAMAALEGLTASASAAAAARVGAADTRGGVVSGSASGTCIGIDLGTTNCAVAVVVNGKPRLIPVAHATGGRGGTGVFPSLVSFASLAHAEDEFFSGRRADAPLVAPDAPARVLVRLSHPARLALKENMDRTAPHTYTHDAHGKRETRADECQGCSIHIPPCSALRTPALPPRFSPQPPHAQSIE